MRDDGYFNKNVLLTRPTISSSVKATGDSLKLTGDKHCSNGSRTDSNIKNCLLFSAGSRSGSVKLWLMVPVLCIFLIF